VLLRVDAPSKLGNWSHEPVDTKLARETKAGAILQLCLYADLVAEAQGLPPEYMYVVAPWSEFQPQRYRFADYGAYFRKVKRALAKAIQTAPTEAPYPLQIEHCDICRWREVCDRRRRDDDHLSLVAGISKLQIHELTTRGTAIVYGLAGMPLPLDWKPSRGSSESYGRVREQARIVVEARTAGTLKFEVLEVEPGFGRARLPEPSEGDVFFDLEVLPAPGGPWIGNTPPCRCWHRRAAASTLDSPSSRRTCPPTRGLSRSKRSRAAR
jgi:predicted RecB family nuclease